MKNLILLITAIILSSCMVSKKEALRIYEEANFKDYVYEVAIVPGFPYKNQKLNFILKWRLNWAAHLYRSGMVENFIFSGGAVHSEYYEAKVMAKYAEAYGIPKENIFIEMEAEHSTENLYFGIQKARELGFTSVVLATDPFQTKMLDKFNETYFEIDVLPITFKTFKPWEMEDREIKHSDDLIAPNFTALRQRENSIERLRGTHGKHLPKLKSLKELELAKHANETNEIRNNKSMIESEKNK